METEINQLPSARVLDFASWIVDNAPDEYRIEIEMAVSLLIEEAKVLGTREYAAANAGILLQAWEDYVVSLGGPKAEAMSFSSDKDLWEVNVSGKWLFVCFIHGDLVIEPAIAAIRDNAAKFVGSATP